MGSEQEVTSVEITSHTEQFEKHFPYYLAMGMDYDQFWRQDVSLVRAYRQAHQIRKQEANEMLWLQGKYFYEALGAISPVLNAFAKQGTHAEKYLSRPFPITVEDRRAEEERISKLKREAFKASLMAFADQWQNNNSKGGE